jgi:hypothetical protein
MGEQVSFQRKCPLLSPLPCLPFFAEKSVICHLSAQRSLISPLPCLLNEVCSTQILQVSQLLRDFP